MSSGLVKINVRPIPGDDEDPSVYILIEGNEKALVGWLGNLLIEHSKGKSGCGMQIYPKGPGRVHFTSSALTGIYIHRLPCDHPTVHSETAAGRRPHKKPLHRTH